MTTVLGAYTYRTSRSAPASGQVTLASDPIAGYANTLQVSETDRYGNNRAAVLATVSTGDTVAVKVEDSGLTFGLITGLPVDAGTYRTFPFTVRSTFEEDSEPANNDEVTLTLGVVVDWPTLAEFAMVLNIEPASAITAWTTTLTRVLNSAIDKVKGDVGEWNDAVDGPTDRHAQAALRMAQLMSQQPEATSEELALDPAYRALLSGKRRRFGVA